MALATRRNDAFNSGPRSSSLLGWGLQAGTGEVAPASWVSTPGDGPEGRTGFVRRTVTTARTGGNSGVYYRSASPEIAGGAAGDVRTLSIWVRFRQAASVSLSGQLRLGAASVSTAGGPAVAVPADTWTRLSVTITATAAYDGFQAWAVVASGTTIPVGGVYEAADALPDLSPTLRSYFDATLPATTEWSYSWEGTPYASASLATEVPALTIAAVAQPTSASVAITVRGGAPGTPLYVLRRDTSGTGIVRETSEGTVVWPALGDTLTLIDYEARQGESTQYLLTDADGTPVATVRVELPQWGTWLKSPGRPYRNARVYYSSDSAATFSARRLVVDIEDAAQRVVFARKRSTPSGGLVLHTLTTDQARALELLLSDGLPLMLDTPSSWGVPYRYISVGDVSRSRAYDFEGLGLTEEARTWSLADVVNTAAPQGVPMVDPGRTYADLPTLFATYVAIPATTDTYEQLATGQES